MIGSVKKVCDFSKVFGKRGASVRFLEGWSKCAILGKDYIKCDVSVGF